MKVTPLELEGILLIELDVFGDARGFFTERFHAPRFRELGLPHEFMQENHSRSAPGVLRGLHYQQNPTQGKLVGVTRGSIFDVAVDIRPESATFGRHIGVELSDLNGRVLWIPAGFAHGFLVTGGEPTDVLYKTDGIYNPAGEGGILWNDPELEILWPTENPTTSERDRSLSTFAEYRANPIDWQAVLAKN